MFKKRSLKGVKRKASTENEPEMEKPLETDTKDLNTKVYSNGFAAKKVKTDSKHQEHAQDAKNELMHNASKEEIQKEIKAIGPSQSVPINVRVTTLTDFQPDVCKDFLQTGYCGYGDTCKFLHIRDESRQKKPINKEWEQVAKNGDSSKRIKSQKEPTSNEGKIMGKKAQPFKCVLCKKDYVKPVKTNCEHIFCAKCFFDRFKKKPECFICGKDTLGACQPVKDEELQELINI